MAPPAVHVTSIFEGTELVRIGLSQRDERLNREFVYALKEAKLSLSPRPFAASAVTYVATRAPDSLGVSRAVAQGAAPTSRQAELFKTTMEDVLGRTVRLGPTERDPGNTSSSMNSPMHCTPSREMGARPKRSNI